MPSTLPTSTLPFRSRITPRRASIRIVRSWLFCAARRYCSPERTYSAHRRRNRIAKTASASAPRIANRNASLGVSRYGSTTLGSGGRKRDERRSAKEPDLRPWPLGAAEEPADECVDRDREQQVEQDRRHERRAQHGRRVDGIAEHDAQRERPERVDDRHHGDREQRRVRAVAPRRLAVAADPVPRDREQERRLAEAREVRGVEQQPDEEAGERAR